MKKIIIIFAAISVLAASCQKETITNENTGITTGKLTATMAGGTKVSYYETEDGPDDWDWSGLQPEWEEGDEIIGFDDAGNTYTLTVESVSGDGVATLSGTVPDGNLHLIYKYGAQASDISNKTLTVDYSDQAGDETLPAVMLADGTVSHGSCNFAFTNAGAIIGIPLADGLQLGSKVTRITVSGENLSSATISLNGGVLTLDADEKANDAISVDFSDLTVIEEDGDAIFSSPVLIAVPAGSVITDVSVTVQATEIPSTTPDKEGVDYVTIAGKKWAKRNIGAEDEKDFGWYFQWGGTIGFYREGGSWISAKYVYEYSSSPEESEYSPNPGEYCLAGGSGFESEEVIEDYYFIWSTTPFNNGFSSFNQTYFDGVKDTVCPEDGTEVEDNNEHKTFRNRALAPSCDAAHVNWGGSWRMPTQTDYCELCTACGGDSDETIVPQAISSANPGKGIYWLSAEQTYIPDYTGAAGLLFCDGASLLFFPAAGNATSTSHSNTGKCFYWSSYIAVNGDGNARLMSCEDGALKVGLYHNTSRYFGTPIRPISD